MVSQNLRDTRFTSFIVYIIKSVKSFQFIYKLQDVANRRLARS